MRLIKKFPKVSVVLPSYNSKGLLNNCLKSLLKTNYPNFEIVIVDDHSTDGSYEYLIKKYSKNPKIKIIRNEKNFGPSRTRNQGIKHSSGEYIAFYETDMEVDLDWMIPLVKALKEDHQLGAVQSKVLDINHRNYIHSTGVWYDPHTFWVLSFACGSHKNEFNEKTEIGIGAVGSMIKRNILGRIGGFDEKIVHSIDDIELGWRVWLAGYRCITIPSSITYHWTAKPLAIRAKQTPNLIAEFHFQKTARIFLKNYEWKNVFKYLPYVIVVFLVRAIKNLSQGNPKPLKALLKSFWWNILILPDTLRERKRIQNLRKRSDAYLFARIGLKGNFFEVYIKQILPRLYFSMNRFKTIQK